MIRDSLRTGVSFGLTSAIITTLGLMVGLEAGTRSKIPVLAGIFTIAVADAFSDALGIHVSEESENAHTAEEVWQSTGFTFISKFLFAAMFAVPVLLLELRTAVYVSVALGLSILALASWYMAARQGTVAWKVVLEHLVIAVAVVIATHYIGHLIKSIFG